MPEVRISKKVYKTIIESYIKDLSFKRDIIKSYNKVFSVVANPTHRDYEGIIHVFLRGNEIFQIRYEYYSDHNITQFKYSFEPEQKHIKTITYQQYEFLSRLPDLGIGEEFGKAAGIEAMGEYFGNWYLFGDTLIWCVNHEYEPSEYYLLDIWDCRK